MANCYSEERPHNFVLVVKTIGYAGCGVVIWPTSFSDRAQTATVAPDSLSWSATPLPIPLPPTVTSATWPSRRAGGRPRSPKAIEAPFGCVGSSAPVASQVRGRPGAMYVSRRPTSVSTPTPDCRRRPLLRCQRPRSRAINVGIAGAPTWPGRAIGAAREHGPDGRSDSPVPVDNTRQCGQRLSEDTAAWRHRGEGDAARLPFYPRRRPRPLMHSAAEAGHMTVRGCVCHE